MPITNSEDRRRFIKTACLSGSLALLPMSVATAMGKTRQKDFLEACRDGNIIKLMDLLLKNPSLINAKDEIGRSGFTLAALAGHSLVSAHLKENGYETDLHESVLDLNWDRYDKLVGDETNETRFRINDQHPMGGCTMWAAAAGGAGSNMWRVYAKCGVPDCQAENSSSPLEKALQFRNLKVAELTAAAMLSNNCDPDPVNVLDQPPLHIAATRGSFEMVELLLRLGANPARKNKNGKTALQVAQEKGHGQVVDLLMTESLLSRTTSNSRKAYNAMGEKYMVPPMEEIPLFLRRRLVGQSHGNLEYVQKEVNADGRLAHSQATTSEICVEACAHIGRKNIVEFLLEKGAPYSICTAVMMNDKSTVQKYLTEDPGRINERGAHHFALLWYPIIGKCDLDMMELLLSKGARVEDQHFLGTTALHWACMRGPFNMVEILVENGANVNRVSRKFKAEGEKPLDLAKDEKIIQYLRSKGATTT